MITMNKSSIENQHIFLALVRIWGWWGLKNAYGVRILNPLKIIGRSLTKADRKTHSFTCTFFNLHVFSSTKYWFRICIVSTLLDGMLSGNVNVFIHKHKLLNWKERPLSWGHFLQSLMKNNNHCFSQSLSQSVAKNIHSFALTTYFHRNWAI